MRAAGVPWYTDAGRTSTSRHAHGVPIQVKSSSESKPASRLALPKCGDLARELGERRAQAVVVPPEEASGNNEGRDGRAAELGDGTRHAATPRASLAKSSAEAATGAAAPARARRSGERDEAAPVAVISERSGGREGDVELAFAEAFGRAGDRDGEGEVLVSGETAECNAA